MPVDPFLPFLQNIAFFHFMYTLYTCTLPSEESPLPLGACWTRKEQKP
jgi:hypothetical protein